MTMITVHWQKCIKNSLWCPFNEKLLNDGRLEARLGDYSAGISGVYIIWTGTDNNRTVLKVGSGIIKDKLAADLKNPDIQAHTTYTIVCHVGFYLIYNWTRKDTKRDREVP